MTTSELLDRGVRYRLRVADYLTLAEAGAFEDLRTELVEGDIVVVSPQFRRHGMVKLGLYDRLRDALRVLPSPLTPVIEFSLALNEHSLVEPDLLLTTEPSGEGAVPLASVALIVEVADTTLAKDRRLKHGLYAAAGIPEYWVADVNARTIRLMWRPVGDAYAEQREAAFGEPIAAATIAGLKVDTAGL